MASSMKGLCTLVVVLTSFDAARAAVLASHEDPYVSHPPPVPHNEQATTSASTTRLARATPIPAVPTDSAFWNDEFIEGIDWVSATPLSLASLAPGPIFTKLPFTIIPPAAGKGAIDMPDPPLRPKPLDPHHPNIPVGGHLPANKQCYYCTNGSPCQNFFCCGATPRCVWPHGTCRCVRKGDGFGDGTKPGNPTDRPKGGSGDTSDADVVQRRDPEPSSGAAPVPGASPVKRGLDDAMRDLLGAMGNWVKAFFGHGPEPPKKPEPPQTPEDYKEEYLKVIEEGGDKPDRTPAEYELYYEGIAAPIIEKALERARYEVVEIYGEDMRKWNFWIDEVLRLSRAEMDLVKGEPEKWRKLFAAYKQKLERLNKLRAEEGRWFKTTYGQLGVDLDMAKALQDKLLEFTATSIGSAIFQADKEKEKEEKDEDEDEKKKHGEENEKNEKSK